MEEFPEFRVGEFVIDAKLGEGGMGAVYKAKQTGLDRYVAIKVLPPAATVNPEFVARFEREAKAAAAIVHPNIIQIYTIGRSFDRPYFAMEFVEGRDLDQLLQNKQFAPNLREAVDVIRSCCAALAVAADRSITHRDIKPANIMIDLNGVVKVMDFGLARSADAGQNKLTMEGTVMGTPNYMPPEQGLGEAVDPRADQYSLGCVMFEMLAGEPVFSAQSMAQILYKHIYEKPKELKTLRPDIPPLLADICHKMIQKKKEDRYAHPSDILKDFEKVVFAPDLPPGDLRSKVRAARAAATQDKPPKDTRALSLELSQDMTLMSLVSPLETREPNALTQGGEHSFAETIVGGTASSALSMAGGQSVAHGSALEREQTQYTQKTVIRKTDAHRPVGTVNASGALSMVQPGGSSGNVPAAAPAAAAVAPKSNKGLVLGGVVAAVVIVGVVVGVLVSGSTPPPTPPVGPPVGTGSTDLVTVPFSQLPKLAKGVIGKLKIDGLDNPMPATDRSMDIHKTYSLVFSKPGYEDQSIALTVDLKGVQPPLKSLKIELKAGAELVKNYQAGVARQSAGALAEAKALFEKVTQVDPEYEDAAARMNELSGAVAQQATASQAALDSAQKAVAGRQWAAAIQIIGGIPAQDPLHKPAQDLLKTAQDKQEQLATITEQIQLDLANGKFSDVDTKLVSAASLAPKEDAGLKELAASAKTARGLIDSGTQLFLDQKYTEAKDAFEKAQKIAPNYDAIKEKLRKIEMALKPTGETGKLIQEVKDAVAAGNFTKAGERLKQIPDEFQDIPLVQDLNSQVLAGLNRKSIEDFLVSFDKGYTAGDEREIKRHLTLRPEGELDALQKALTAFDKELKFSKSEHRIVRMAFLDRGGRQARVSARWKYDVVSLPYQANLKGELARDLTIALEQGQWQVTAIATRPVGPGEDKGAEQGGEAQPNVVEGVKAAQRLVGKITAVTPQTVTAGEDPAKLATMTGENTVTISVTREQLDAAMQGTVSGKLVFDVYTPDKVVSFPLSNVNAVVEGKYVGSLRVDIPGDGSTVCVVQAGKFDDFKVDMVAVQSTARTGLPKMPSPNSVAVTKKQVPAGTPVTMQISVVNPENNLVHYLWTTNGGSFRFARTDLASNLWFPPVQAGKYKISIETESAYGQRQKLTELTLESLGPDVDHRPRGMIHFDATHQPGFGKMLGLCFDERNHGFLISQNEKSYTFSQVTSGMAKAGDVSLMREEDAQNLKILVYGQQVFVLDRKNNRVQSYPLQENLFVNLPAATMTFGGQGQGAGKFQSADDMVVTPLSEVAILDATSRTVSLFTSSGRYIMSFGSFGQAPGQLDKPVGLAVDGRGHCFVLDAGRKVVIHFDGGRMVREIKFDVGADEKKQKLASLAIDMGTGRLFVLDTGLSRIYAVDSSTGQWLANLKWGGAEAGLGALRDLAAIAVDRMGRLYVVSSGGTVVQKFMPDGEFLGRLESTAAAAGTFTDLAIAPDGVGYLLNNTDKTVHRLSAEGLTTQVLGMGILKAPVAVGCDGAGNLLVVDTKLEGGCLARFDPAGKPLANFLAGKCAEGSDVSCAGGKILVVAGGKGLGIDAEKGETTATLDLGLAKQAAIDGTGQVHYSFGGTQVGLVKADGAKGENWQVAFKLLGSLCASPDGMVYAVDVTNRQLTGADSRNGSASLALPAPEGCPSPVAVGVDGLGHVYLLDGPSGGVSRYIPSAGP